jgi:hypothetical protein
MPELRYVDATRSPGLFARIYAAIAATRVARFVSRRVNWKLDPFLLRVTRGRLASTLVSPPRSPMHATVVNDQGEPARLWVLADRVFPAFADYRRRAEQVHRTIPIVQLTELG